MVYLGVDTNALLGNTLQIAVIVVVPFIIMGQVLTRCGGSDFFADLAAVLMGRFRGGSGKIAVVGPLLRHGLGQRGRERRERRHRARFR